MKKLLLFSIICISIQTFACTTFLLHKDGQLIFGRNYDWITGAGIVHTNQRGLFKTSAADKSTLNWVSLYGSITFNQYGKEFPTGGMNERGLVVELMWLDGTKYPPADERGSVEVLQWLQYQLDMHASVEEVIASDKKIRISDKATPLHFLIADAKGKAATIEFLNGRMVAHYGDKLTFPVLTNDTYSKSIQAADRTQATGAMPGNNSLDRFVSACKMVNELKTTNTTLNMRDYAFSILDKVAQGDFTKWSIVYDITSKTVLFKTADFKTIKSFSFAAFDFACTSPSKMYDMNQSGRGDVTANFILPDKNIKRSALDKAVKESSQYVTIDEADKKLLLEFEESVTCDGRK